MGESIDSAKESLESLAILATDSETYKMLYDFPGTYFDALSFTEKTHFVFRYGIDIALVFVGGAGIGVLAIKNTVKITAILKKATELIKLKRFNQTVTGKKTNTTVKVEVKNKPESNFITKGVVVKNVLELPEGRALLSELKNANPNTPNNTLLRRAKEFLQTGKSLPVVEKVRSTTELYKYVPHGKNVSNYSPYFMSKKQMTELKSNPSNIADSMALPKASEATKYDIYKITPKVGKTPNVFISKVAETTEGKIIRKGGGIQTLVPNRNLWTEPKLAGTIGN